MAQAMLADNVLAATNWLKQNEDKTAFSFVFKTMDIDCGNKKINWQNYGKPTKDQDIKECQRLCETDMDQTNRDEEVEMEIDELTKRLVVSYNSYVQKILFDLFKLKDLAPSNVLWFIQHEIGKDTGYHCHVLIHSDMLKPAQGKWIRSQLNQMWSRWLVAHCDIELSPTERLKIRDLMEQNEWVSILTYKHNQTKKHYTKMVMFSDMVAHYFLQKIKYPSENNTGYLISRDSAFQFAYLSMQQRFNVAKLYSQHKQIEAKIEATVTTPQEAKRRRVETQKEMSIKETVLQLVSKRVCSTEDWMMGDPDSYVHLMAQPGGESLLKNTLDISTLTIARTKTAFELCLEKSTENINIRDTKIYEIFVAHSWNPIKLMHAMACVLNRQGGKRNTILLHGPASTGKSIIAQTIAKSVVNVGCYNPANVNFPFNDCTNKNLIWVEEAGNFGQQVNQFKAICSGQTVRIDQKGKGSKQIEPTPVIMTTNEDITQVRVGCELRPEHTQPIKDRMLNINLTKKLPGDFGLIDDSEWPNICRWLVTNGYHATMANYVSRWSKVPDWSEDWSKPPINTDSTGSPSQNKEKPGDDTKSSSSTPEKRRTSSVTTPTPPNSPSSPLQTPHLLPSGLLNTDSRKGLTEWQPELYDFEWEAIQRDVESIYQNDWSSVNEGNEEALGGLSQHLELSSSEDLK
nr:MAG: NS1 [Canine parvovirus]